MDDLVLTPHPQIVVSDMHDVLFLLHLETGETLELNKSAAAFWRLADGRTKLTEILKKLVRLFEVEEKVLRADTEQVIKELKKKNFIFAANPRLRPKQKKKTH